MTITEYAILVFKSPHNLSEPTIQQLFRQISAWQSECSGFPLTFFANPEDPFQVHLITGWESVAAHEAWIRGERNQELLRVVAPFIDLPKVRMVHLDVDFEGIPRDERGSRMVIGRYEDARVGEVGDRSGQAAWFLIGRDLASDGDSIYYLRGSFSLREGGGGEEGGPSGALERWALKRIGLQV